MWDLASCGSAQETTTRSLNDFRTKLTIIMFFPAHRDSGMTTGSPDNILESPENL